MSVIIRPVPRPSCEQCGELATVSIYVARPSIPYMLLSQRAFKGNYCQQHSIERVEYQAELEREYKEDLRRTFE